LSTTSPLGGFSTWIKSAGVALLISAKNYFNGQAKPCRQPRRGTI